MFIRRSSMKPIFTIHSQMCVQNPIKNSDKLTKLIDTLVNFRQLISKIN